MTEEQPKRQDQEKDPTIGKEAVDETINRYEGDKLDSETEREMGKVERALEDTFAAYDDGG